jgi:hypothetical protein
MNQLTQYIPQAEYDPLTGALQMSEGVLKMLLDSARRGDAESARKLRGVEIPKSMVDKANRGDREMQNLLSNLPEGVVSSQKLNFNLPGYPTAETFNADRFKAPANAIPNAIAPMQFTGSKVSQQPQMFPNWNPPRRKIQQSFDRTMRG